MSDSATDLSAIVQEEIQELLVRCQGVNQIS